MAPEVARTCGVAGSIANLTLGVSLKPSLSVSSPIPCRRTETPFCKRARQISPSGMSKVSSLAAELGIDSEQSP
jgi:hypothetical protein